MLSLEYRNVSKMDEHDQGLVFEKNNNWQLQYVVQPAPLPIHADAVCPLQVWENLS